MSHQTFSMIVLNAKMHQAKIHYSSSKEGKVTHIEARELTN